MATTHRGRRTANHRQVRDQAARLSRSNRQKPPIEQAARDAGQHAYRRAIRDGADHETAEIAADNAQAAYQARNGDPSDPLTKVARQRTTFQRRADAAIRMGLSPYAAVHPVEVAREHRPSSPGATPSPTATARTAPQRRETRTASATSPSGSSGGSGGDSDPDSGAPASPAHRVTNAPSAAAIAAAIRVLDRAAARLLREGVV